jgi:hypothetical protein
MHDSGGLTTELNGPPGGTEDQTCADNLVGRTGWKGPTVGGQAPQIPDSALTPVPYEVLKEDLSGSWQQIATFTTSARTKLASPIPLSLMTEGERNYVYTAAPFAVRLSGVQPGDGLQLGPLPNIPAIHLTAVDCGDSGFFSGWEGDPGLCTSARARILVDDVNGDGRADVVCQSPPNGGLSVGLSRPGGWFVHADWHGTPGLCRSRSQLLIGDVNRDGRADLVCHSMTSGLTSVALAGPRGRFTRVDWRGKVPVCRTVRTRLLLGDVDGDRRADLVCQDPATGKVQVALARTDGRFTGVDWHGVRSMCRAAGTSLQLGKVNGDARADLVCQDPATGGVQVALARSRGRFPLVDTRSTPGLCTATGTQLRLGDVNGDHRADLICHDPTGVMPSTATEPAAAGYVWIALAKGGAWYHATDWQRNLGFCPASSPGSLQTADLDGDGRTDLLCHDTVTGHLHTAYSDL